MEAREALLKARELFLKIADADEATRQDAAEFHALMDEWGISLENMYPVHQGKLGSIASKAISFWMESREASRSLDPKFRRPKREREVWLLRQEGANALEMIPVLRLREPPEDDTYYRKVQHRSSSELKRLVEAGQYPRDLNNERNFSDDEQSVTAGDSCFLSVCYKNFGTNAMIIKEEQELEDFIENWYYGAEMHEFAKALGRYLLQFVDHLGEQDISPKTRRKHIDNCWYIGYLECNFGCQDEFIPGDVFYDPEAPYEYEFVKKVSSSKSAMTSYKSTWRKLYSYTRGLGHISSPGRAEFRPSNGESPLKALSMNQEKTDGRRYSEWSRKGATLSDKSAQREFGLTQEEIIQAINDGRLQYRQSSIHGNPFLRLLRHEVEALVEGKHESVFLKRKRFTKELSEVNRDIKRLKAQIESLENRKKQLREMFGE